MHVIQKSLQTKPNKHEFNPQRNAIIRSRSKALPEAKEHKPQPTLPTKELTHSSPADNPQWEEKI